MTDYALVGQYGYLVYINGSLVWSTPGALLPSSYVTLYIPGHTWKPGLVANAGDRVDIRAGYGPAEVYAAGYLDDAWYNPNEVRIPYVPPAAAMIRIDSNTGTYQVPPNRHLVIRDWSCGGPSFPYYLYGCGITINVNGVAAWQTYKDTTGHGTLESGILAKPNDLVTITPSYLYPEAYLLGFLKQ